MYTLTEVGIQTTAMAIRELLMEYFKGTCVRRVADTDHVRLRGDYLPSTRYRYQRQQLEEQAPQRIEVAGKTVMRVQCNPYKVVFVNSELDRSPQLRQVKALVEKFMSDYLGGVEKEYDDA